MRLYVREGKIYETYVGNVLEKERDMLYKMLRENEKMRQGICVGRERERDRERERENNLMIKVCLHYDKNVAFLR